MSFIFIIAGAVFVFYLFNNDRKDVKINVLQRGGLKTIYPNFVEYARQAHDRNKSFFNSANFVFTSSITIFALLPGFCFNTNEADGCPSLLE
jgi:hypothetical protein